MTSVMYSTRRGPEARRRTWAAGVALAGALAVTLTACGGGGSDDGSSAAPGTTATADGGATGGASSGGSGDGSANPTASASASAGPLEGSWLATDGGEAVVLMAIGDKAALYATGGTVCKGTLGEESGTRVFRLGCASGRKDRVVGEVDSVGGDTLKVTWDSAVGTETYRKAGEGSLPSGLPEAMASQTPAVGP
ncbi:MULTISPECIES: hypothetical protein [unclassified Streptomyces]|uniref:hypothetical protein n=1 Tax=unclassified Streptomyces TaxID=2593676 RepID=UPI003D755EBE